MGSPKANEMFGIVCNIGMGVPSSTMFKRYHMEHHMFQGGAEKDVDVPTEWEGKFFTNTALKALWLLLQPFFYALRPTFVRPKAPRNIDLFNTLVILVTDLAVFHVCGLRGLVYIVASSLLGMGFHPVAGHFIAEHYVFPGDEVETYSYYGALNYLCWNVGYHNEHHDFPRSPGGGSPKSQRLHQSTTNICLSTSLGLGSCTSTSRTRTLVPLIASFATRRMTKLSSVTVSFQ